MPRHLTSRSPSPPLWSRFCSKLVEAGGVLIKRKRCPYGTGSYARRTRAVEIAAEARQASMCGEEGDGEEPESENVGAAGGKASAGGDEGFFSRGARIAKGGGMSGSPAVTVTVSPSSPAPSPSRSSSIPLTDDGESTRMVGECRMVFLLSVSRELSWFCVFYCPRFPSVFLDFSLGFPLFGECFFMSDNTLKVHAAHFRVASSRILRT